MGLLSMLGFGAEESLADKVLAKVSAIVESEHVSADGAQLMNSVGTNAYTLRHKYIAQPDHLSRMAIGRLAGGGRGAVLTAGSLVGLLSSACKNAGIDVTMGYIKLLQPLDKLSVGQKDAIAKYLILSESKSVDKKNADAAICGILWNDGDCVVHLGKWPREGLVDDYDETTRFCIAAIATLAETGAVQSAKAIEYIQKEFDKCDQEVKNLILLDELKQWMED